MTWGGGTFCLLLIINKVYCKGNKQTPQRTMKSMSKTFVVDSHYTPRNQTYDYLHMIQTETLRTSAYERTEPLSAHTLRQLEKGARSPPSKCPTFPIVTRAWVIFLYRKLTGEPVCFFLRQKSQLDLSWSLPPTWVPGGSQQHYLAPWRWQKRNSDFCTPCSWNTRGTCWSRMPLLSERATLVFYLLIAINIRQVSLLRPGNHRWNALCKFHVGDHALLFGFSL